MITVFTPTFNRAHTLERLYESLVSQTDFNFEWLVVDDGSTDNTEKYFEEIIKNDNPFEIRYIKQPNGGKHRAINNGVKVAKGDLFFIVDSDDYLRNDAIEKLCEWVNSLDASKKWAGVSGARGYSADRYIGSVYADAPYIDAKNTERQKYHLLGDKAEAYFTEVLKKYPFPEFEGEKFLTEEVVWNAIAIDGYFLRWYKDIIYIGNYLEDGLTNSGNSKYKQNPNGTIYWGKIQLKAFPKNLKKKLSVVNRCYEAVEPNMSKKQLAKELGVSTFMVRLAVFAVGLGRKLRK